MSTDPLTGAALHARARKAALADAIRGRTTPETETVETLPSSGFDGGCRTPAPLPRDPITEHDALIVQLALHSKVGGSSGRW